MSTTSELEPGVGGSADHPAPAVMADENGVLRVAGEGPSTAPWQVPTGDSFDLQSGDVSPEAKAKLDVVSDPKPFPISRPDIGTE